MSQTGFIFPNFRGEKKTYLSCHHLENDSTKAHSHFKVGFPKVFRVTTEPGGTGFTAEPPFAAMIAQAKQVGGRPSSWMRESPTWWPRHDVTYIYFVNFGVGCSIQQWLKIWQFLCWGVITKCITEECQLGFLVDLKSIAEIWCAYIIMYYLCPFYLTLGPFSLEDLKK